MALKLQSFKFVVVNHQFIYSKGVKPEEREKLDPEFVKLSGIACFDNFDVRICYILDSFQEFKMSKSELTELLFTNNVVILGNGILKLDNNYNYRLDLDSYNMDTYEWKLDITTKGKK